MSVDLEAYMVGHNLSEPALVHSNLASAFCNCNGKIENAVVIVARPPETGDSVACFICGGLAQRTGTCYTCTECGANTGCG